MHSGWLRTFQSARSPVLATYGYSARKYVAVAIAPSRLTVSIAAGRSGFGVVVGLGVAAGIGVGEAVGVGRALVGVADRSVPPNEQPPSSPTARATARATPTGREEAASGTNRLRGMPENLPISTQLGQPFSTPCGQEIAAVRPSTTPAARRSTQRGHP